MNDKTVKPTRYGNYKAWLENHKVFSVVMVTAFIVAPLSLLFGLAGNIYIYFSDPEEDPITIQMIDLVRSEGCIFFNYDSLYPVPLNQLPNNVVDEYVSLWMYSARFGGEYMVITGHTDEFGPREFNSSFGEQAANNASLLIKNYYKDQFGASTAPPIQTISYGEEAGFIKLSNGFTCKAKVTYRKHQQDDWK